jgi:probable rRNA maturation factor
MSRDTGLLIQDKRLSMDLASLEACVSGLDAAKPQAVPAGSIEVAFVDEAECSRLHQAFFNDPEITDVMTFPGDTEDGHAGDIAICPAVAETAAQESGLPFHEELTLYLVHGWLHLAGLGDSNEEERKQMRQAEATMMDHLRREKTLLSCIWGG